MEIKTKGKVLLTGTCWYELTGLWSLLSDCEYDVYRVPLGYTCSRESWDLIIVALSAEPLAGWGRHLSRIRELRAEMSGEMLVLVPERLEMLKVLRNICPVYSGYMPLSDLERTVRMALNRKASRAGKFRLTSGQRLVLKRFSERGRVCPPLLNPGERSLYWHYSRLAENVGVRDFRMLLMTGLDREIHKIEEFQSGQ
ncbi:TPA: hypothetical protein ACHYY3_004031 [Escherichia coli]|uniref:hypothetical protein n=1 Tax=Escherichia coli TaxID=562 RepID=UPI000FB3CD7A|nr:hypothetical protein [Escherichia coli]EEC8626678.1 hypothetical protein [Escherichia coli]EEY8045614.1 hypothetical protein [Escherichia coli]EEZ0865741.1 hypothetical protein [Escherichia coli]EEZ1905274.1 hypothetical protein [Escherichia coli]EFC2365995.1 hypothetical protein [Escherichia coli]